MVRITVETGESILFVVGTDGLKQTELCVPDQSIVLYVSLFIKLFYQGFQLILVKTWNEFQASIW